MKPVPPADFSSETVVTGCEAPSTSVNQSTLASSPRRASSSRELRKRPSRARTPQSATAQLGDCCQPVGSESPSKSRCEMTGSVGGGSPLLNRRRSARSAKVIQSDEPTVDGSTSPQFDGPHVFKIDKSPRSQSSQSPCAESAANRSLRRSLQSSPRKLVIPGNDSSHSPVSSGHVVKSPGVGRPKRMLDGVIQFNEPTVDSSSQSPCTQSAANCSPRRSLQSSPRKLVIPGNDASHSPVSSGHVVKSPGVGRPRRMSDGVQNHKKLMYQLQKKLPKGRVRSLEPAHSPRVGRPRKKSDVVGSCPEVVADSKQSRSTPEVADSGRQLRRRTKPSSDNQCQPTPADKEVNNTSKNNNSDSLQCGKELVSKIELGEGDVSSTAAGPVDSDAMIASSNDVSTMQLLQSPWIFSGPLMISEILIKHIYS